MTNQIKWTADEIREQAVAVSERIYAGADFPGADDIIALARSVADLARAVGDLAAANG